MNFAVSINTDEKHRSMRVQAYAALERAQKRGNTDMDLQLKAADFQEAEGIAWELYSDTTNNTPHEACLLLANLFFAQDDFENALHFAGEALENAPDDSASKAFERRILQAIEDAKPIESSIPDPLPAQGKIHQLPFNGKAARLNGTPQHNGDKRLQAPIRRPNDVRSQQARAAAQNEAPQQQTQPKPNNHDVTAATDIEEEQPYDYSQLAGSWERLVKAINAMNPPDLGGKPLDPSL